MEQEDGGEGAPAVRAGAELRGEGVRGAVPEAWPEQQPVRRQRGESEEAVPDLRQRLPAHHQPLQGAGPGQGDRRPTLCGSGLCRSAAAVLVGDGGGGWGSGGDDGPDTVSHSVKIASYIYLPHIQTLLGHTHDYVADGSREPGVFDLVNMQKSGAVKIIDYIYEMLMKLYVV